MIPNGWHQMTPCYPVLLTVLSEALLLSIPPKWAGLFQAHCQVCLTSLRLILHAQLQNIRTDTGRWEEWMERERKPVRSLKRRL
jgi:hypothetical protein